MMADVFEALVRYAQNGIANDAKKRDDKTIAISCAALFRPWAPGNYKVGDIRTKDGVPYESMYDHDSTVNTDWTINERSIWKPYHSREIKWALPFIHPTGAHDIYKTGEYMVYNGKIYVALMDTSYSPDEYAQAWEVKE